jgi:hypothetical protein
MRQSAEGLRKAIAINRALEEFDVKVGKIWRDSARANNGLPNYLDVQDKIAALGSPLSDRQMADIQGAGTTSTAPASAAPTLIYDPKTRKMVPAR